MTPAGVLVGGSAGALEGVKAILAALRADLVVPVAIVLHVAERGDGALRDVLARATPLPVREALDKEPFAGGAAYLAPAGYHLLVDAGPSLALSVDPPVKRARPSLDVLFTSGAEVLGPGVVAIVLSGASDDGADGAAAVAAAGGVVYVEEPERAAHATMPASALARCPGARVRPVRALADELAALCGGAR